jgi:hypothetical protein
VTADDALIPQEQEVTSAAEVHASVLFNLFRENLDPIRSLKSNP